MLTFLRQHRGMNSAERGFNSSRSEDIRYFIGSISATCPDGKGRRGFIDHFYRNLRRREAGENRHDKVAGVNEPAKYLRTLSSEYH